MGINERGSAPTAAALLRRPSMRVRHQVLTGLRDAGFGDILPAHLGVFQHPGPEGQRPGVLAARNHSSKQSMNHLLHQLEAGGYLVRVPQEGDRRTRVVRLTERGRAVYATIAGVVAEIERAWADALGASTYDELRRGLARLEEVLDGVVSA